MAAVTWKCTGCGAPLVIRAKGRTQSIACEYCGCVLDAQDPQRKILHRYASAIKYKPLIPLGRRGVLRGEEMECVGYMRRAVRYYGVDYEWSEYLLYNPYKGYRWLVESNGHWLWLKPMATVPGRN
jgi:hypothetical protein